MVSVIIPCYNEEKNIMTVYNEIKKCFNKQVKDYELIFVDDGSTDETISILNNIKDKKVKIINFSRNFGKEAAMLAGLKKASGDYVSIIDCDMQQNPKYLLEMKKKLDSDLNIDEVAAYPRRNNKSFLKNHFYKIFSMESNFKIKNGASDFRMFRKKVVDAILSLSEKSRFSKGIFSYIGFNIYYMPYDVEKRLNGVSKWKKMSLFKYAISGITDFTVKPLLWQLKFGIILFIISILLLIMTIVLKLELLFIITSIILLIISITQILSGITSYYLGKIFIEVKNRPIYIEKSKKD